MERANTDLMLQNLCIMEENERLRRMARELDQENKKMLADLKIKQQQMAASSRTAANMALGGASSGATAQATKSGKKQPK
ncbi:hypothetical protein ACQ4PT_041954 [Festuca glaucescens]